MGLSRKSKYSIGLSCLAVIGVGATAFLSAKNSRVYYRVLSLECADKWEELPEEEFKEKENKPFDSILTKKEKAVIFGKSFWPTILSGTLTAGCIIGAQMLDIREILGLSAGLAAVTYKYDDMRRYLQERFPEQYKEAQKFVDGQAAHRALEDKRFKKEETYDGRQRYYFPLSDQIVYMKPEDWIDIQAYMSSTIGTELEVHLNDILDYIHYTLGYKDVHICDKDYFWEFDPDAVPTKSDFPLIDTEDFDDIYDDSGETIVCRVVATSIDPKYNSKKE